MVKAVFLDRDGVLVIPEFKDGRSFAPRRLEDLAFYPEARDCLVRLKKAGYVLIVVTNQPDVGRGLVARETVEAMHAQLVGQLPIDAVKMCCHTGAPPECSCRKPKPGLILEAAETFGIDLVRSIMVGDRASDMMAGKAAGCRGVFIDLDYAEPKPEHAIHVAKSLTGAVEWILANPARP